MQAVLCLNCRAKVKGLYCSSCGQKTTVKKLSWKSLAEEFVHFFSHAEHSFVYTSKMLISAPGMVVKEFLDGRRKKVHKPLTLLFIWVAVYKIISSFYAYCEHTFQMHQFERTDPQLRILWGGARNATLEKFENLIIVLLQAPVLLLIGWVLFRRTKNSSVENLVAILYGITFTSMVSLALATTGFILRIFRVPLSTGTLNDFYFLCYYIAIAWVIYSFEKVYRPEISTVAKIAQALLLALLANYASDLLWYGLYSL